MPRFSTLAALAGALSVGLEELVGGGEIGAVAADELFTKARGIAGL